jgi:hypothetical protein
MRYQELGVGGDAVTGAVEEGRCCSFAAVALLLVGAALTLGGCASVSHRPLKDDNDATDKGIRYYGASPYVLVYANSGGGITTEIKYLPDRHKLMTARPKQWLSSLDTTLKFTNGVLTQADTTADTSIVPKAVLTAAKTAAAALLAKADQGGPSVPNPRLFKIVRAANGEYVLIGGATDHAFQLTPGSSGGGAP